MLTRSMEPLYLIGKKRTTEIKHNDKTTFGNTTEKAAGTCKALEVPVFEEQLTLTKMAKAFLHSSIHDRLGCKQLADVTEPLIEIDQVSGCLGGDCHHPPCFYERKTDLRYDQVTPFQCHLIVVQCP